MSGSIGNDKRVFSTIVNRECFFPFTVFICEPVSEWILMVRWCMWWRLRSFLLSIQLENMDAVNLDRIYVAKIVFHSYQFIYALFRFTFPWMKSKEPLNIFHSWTLNIFTHFSYVNMQNEWNFVSAIDYTFSPNWTKWIESKIEPVHHKLRQCSANLMP